MSGNTARPDCETSLNKSVKATAGQLEVKLPGGWELFLWNEGTKTWDHPMLKLSFDDNVMFRKIERGEARRKSG